MNGVLITLEGIDGSGKTTVAKSLYRNLPRSHPKKKFLFTSEPTEGEAGKILRSHLAAKNSTTFERISQAKKMEELWLFMADHADHLARIVIPGLDEGAIVISDRYADSTAAYQGVTLRGIVPQPLSWIREIYAAWNIMPRRTLFFSVQPKNAILRLSSRENKEKFERLDFLKEVDQNFRNLIAMEPNRFVIVDGEREVDYVAEKALESILEVI